MNAAERRAEIINILRVRRKICARELAARLGVSIRTIHNDIRVLTDHNMIYTQVGGGGGIFLSEEISLTHRPYGNTMEYPHLETLIELYYSNTGLKKKHLYEIIMKYGPSSIKL